MKLENNLIQNFNRASIYELRYLMFYANKFNAISDIPGKFHGTIKINKILLVEWAASLYAMRMLHMRIHTPHIYLVYFRVASPFCI